MEEFEKKRAKKRRKKVSSGTPSGTDLDHNQAFVPKLMERKRGFEPPTLSLAIRCFPVSASSTTVPTFLAEYLMLSPCVHHVPRCCSNYCSKKNQAVYHFGITSNTKQDLPHQLEQHLLY